MIRTVEITDAEAICRIYNHYVAEAIVTFEEQPVPVAEIENRIRQLAVAYPWVVIEQDQRLVGYAYASPWKTRSAYRYAVESGVYVAPDYYRRGLGTELYTRLISDLRKKRFHGVVAGIALPNPASIALHEKLGYEKVAQFREIGLKFNRWIDVGYWELILNE